MQTARRFRLAWSLFSLVVALVGFVRGHAPAVLLLAAAPAAILALLFGLVDLFKQRPESWVSSLTALCGGCAAVLLVMVWVS